jgi:hypothetical protein
MDLHHQSELCGAKAARLQHGVIQLAKLARGTPHGTVAALIPDEFQFLRRFRKSEGDA